MAPKKANATIKPENTSTANITPTQEQTKQTKKVSPLTSGKLPPLKSPKPPMESIGSRIIFVSHLPNGLFEEELSRFFSQFGDVTKVFVARSKRTSRSRGYGYVQFRYREVARIAASAVNNYFMFGRILKASLVSPKFGDRVPRKLARTMRTNLPRKYANRMNANIRNENGFHGEPSRHSRRLRQVAKVQKALAELKQAEIELPDMPQCFVEVKRLVHTYSDSKRIIKPPVIVKKEEDEQNTDSSDDEDAFVPLEPSDWVVIEQESIPDGEDAAALKSEAQNLVKVEKDEALKSNTKKTAGGKVQKKTGKKETLSKKAKKSSRKSLRTGTSK